MNCPNCGQESQTGASYCVKCGEHLSQPLSRATSELDPSTLAEEAPPVADGHTHAGDAAAVTSHHDDEDHATSPVGQGPQTREFKAQDFTVLIVEDTLDSQLILSLDLQSAGYRVMTANNGEEALKVCAVSPPDLILMDIAMPELDGLGATRRLRERPDTRDIPVVAITAFDTDGFRRAAYDVGIDGYLTKPLDFDRMHNLIRKLLPLR